MRWLVLTLQFAVAEATPWIPGWAEDPPVLGTLVEFSRRESDLRLALDRYALDLAAILRRYEVEYSPVRHARLRRFYDTTAAIIIGLVKFLL